MQAPCLSFGRALAECCHHCLHIFKVIRCEPPCVAARASANIDAAEASSASPAQPLRLLTRSLSVTLSQTVMHGPCAAVRKAQSGVRKLWCPQANCASPACRRNLPQDPVPQSRTPCRSNAACKQRARTRLSGLQNAHFAAVTCIAVRAMFAWLLPCHDRFSQGDFMLQI